MLAAIDQKEVMQAAMGEVPDTWKAPMGFIVPGMPSATEAGMDTVRKRKTIDELKRWWSSRATRASVWLHASHRPD